MSSKPEEIDEEEEETQDPEEAQKAPAASQEPEIKLVINMRGKRAVVGVQAPGCDPVLTTVEGELEEILFVLGGFVEEAQEKWKKSPKYPKSDLAQPAAPAPTQATSSTGASKPKTAPKAQNALF